MDWEADSALSDSIAAISIIGSLIYVGLRTRQNNCALHHASIRKNMMVWQTLFTNAIDSKEVATVMINGMKDMSSLDPADQIRFCGLVMKAF